MTNGLRVSALLLLGAGACTTPPGEPPLRAPMAVTGPAETATRAALQRIATRDGEVQAVIATMPDAVAQAQAVDRGERRGPLAGVPVLIKDNVEAIGLPTTGGSLALASNNTGRDSPLVARLRAAGAVILGKTNLSEWANFRSNDSISGWSGVGGQTRNPHALNRNPCGSSSGSGAAVGAGYVDYSIGTETNGSISCPSSANGIVGFKPTVGLVPRTHIIPISATQDTAGPMTRTVRQAAEMMTVIAGSDASDPVTAEADRRKVDYVAALDANALKGKRLGVMRFASGFGTDPLLEAALNVLRAQGATIVDIKAIGIQTPGTRPLLVLQAEFKDGLNKYLAAAAPAVTTRSLADVIAFNKASLRELGLFGQDLLESSEKTKGLDEPGYKEALAAGLKFARENGIDRLLSEHKVDALIGPTASAAWPIDAVLGDQSPGGGGGYLAAIGGYPHLTVPMGKVRGMPVGLSFLGPKWSDAFVLSLGHAYELARGPLPGPSFRPSVEDDPEVRALSRSAVRP